MGELVAAICVVFIGIMGFKAYQAYPSYKGSLYQELRRVLLALHHEAGPFRI